MVLPDAPPPYATIVFDCDSTLSTIEGIEELMGPRPAQDIVALTERAMNGEIALEDVFGLRLERVRPSARDLARVAELYYERRVPRTAELIAALHAADKRVVVCSGGLLQAVGPFAARLGVPSEDVWAVRVDLDADGAYAGFDAASPCARSGGKIEVVGELARSSDGALAHVGDGATDLEVAPFVDRFIAFGGVVRRAPVFDNARVACDVNDMAALVPLLLSPAEIDQLRDLPDHAPLLAAAEPYHD